MSGNSNREPYKKNRNICIKESNLKRVEAAIRIKRKAKYSTFDRKWKKLADELKNSN